MVRFLVILIVLFSTTAFAQRHHPKRVQHYITDENINQFTHWKQLFAAEKERHNKNYVPKMIALLAKPEKLDSTQLVQLVDSLVHFRSYKSDWFVFDLLCRPIDFSLENEFTKMAKTLRDYGGYKALNKHFLKDSIPQMTDKNTFRATVYYAVREKCTWMNGSVYFVPYQKPVPPKPLPKEVQQQLARHLTCKSAFLINDSAFQHVGSLNQLLFLDTTNNSKEKILLDSLWRFSYGNPQKISAILTNLIRINSLQVKRLVYVFMTYPIYFVHDLNVINSIAPHFQTLEVAQLADSVFLGNKLVSLRQSPDYFKQVTQALGAEVGECYACEFKTSDELQIEYMKTFDVSHIDRKIEHIINKHSAFSYADGSFTYAQQLDTILKQVLQIENVTDAYYDYCRVKISIYPGWMTLGIVYWPNESFAVQKCYPIQLGSNFGRMNRYKRQALKQLNLGGNSDRMVFDPNRVYYQVGFVDAERRECERMRQERIHYQNLIDQKE